MKLSFVQLTSLLGLAQSALSAPSDFSYPFTSDYTSNNFQHKGVSLGSWLVTEPFINPTLYNSTGPGDTPVDEYHLTKKLGKDQAKELLSKHWDTWITEDDFKKIKSFGLNMVRIPVGYWAFELLEDDPYVQGQEEYLDKAIAWGHKHGIKVWVDLHGVPGSQNGFDNSGLRTPVPGWFNNTENVDVSKKVLHHLFAKYGGSNFTQLYNDTVYGVSVVNEPFSTGGLPLDNLTDFMDYAYHDGRKAQQVNNTIIYHDGFQQIGYWNYWRNSTGANPDPRQQNYNILIDHHHYASFDIPSLNRTIEETVNFTREWGNQLAEEQPVHPSVVGEWSAALTDCTPWLNGVGRGARYDNTFTTPNKYFGSCAGINDFDTWSDEHKTNTRKFVEIQLLEFTTKAKGFIYWTWKTENAKEWDFQFLAENDIIPQPLDNYKYFDKDGNEKSDSGNKDSSSFSFSESGSVSGSISN
ncbi:hypothetical protein HYPBUDRAFT_150080 [Hyphopichia burtonii NRRL Y-1933]|uniref:glucan 1,3-beta-glucosidase n=1 Tax=Hyphopichia burtonii NRRL Y-1933 TaxID=984485 RepID=A0A1E4RDS7_9ASCO|nr:hypothetical protein HYPBUDRAFT_150080 [Hyphopichia burtonii NRRL Y-1933]ODV65429.1 hypothetical protein HYPBUDRAFT_150080 [Hyphopichia burtonii NRRL Y-1933]